MSNLMHFLTDLALNPVKQQAFMANPEAVMNAAGLSEADQLVIESRDKQEITHTFANKRIQLASTFGDPGPDPTPDPDPAPDPPPEPNA